MSAVTLITVLVCISLLGLAVMARLADNAPVMPDWMARLDDQARADIVPENEGHDGFWWDR